MKKVIMIMTFMVVFSLALPSSAGQILYSPFITTHQVEYNEPIGQTFFAEDELVEAGLYFDPINPTEPYSDSIQYDLYSGAGTSGTLLESTVFSLDYGFMGFHMEDFSDIALNIGDTYSLVASILGDSAYWGINETLDPSAPSGIRYGELSSQSFALSVNPLNVNPVPLPTVFWLIGSGIICMIGVTRLK
jgi:hypothetical protein